MMLEIWVRMHKELSQYEISSSGRIRRRINIRHPERGKNFSYLKPFESKGSLRVQIGRIGKKTISRLVFYYFCGGLNDRMVVAHLDGDFSNNLATNLVQVSQKENIGHKKIHGTWQAGPSHPRSLSSHSYEAADRVRDLLNSAPKYASGKLKRGVAKKISEELNVSINFVRDVGHKGAWQREKSICLFSE